MGLLVSGNSQISPWEGGLLPNFAAPEIGQAVSRLRAAQEALRTNSDALRSDLLMQQMMSGLLTMVSGLLGASPQTGSPAGAQAGATGEVSPTGSSAAPAALSGSPKRTAQATGTGYYPDSSALEGGYVDRKGKKLNTLQDFLAGKADYVSVAMDKNQNIPYGTKLRIPELEKKHGKAIEFRVVDTGGAFTGKGNSRIDICTASKKDSEDPTINGPLTLQFY